MSELASAIVSTANKIGVNPLDLATAISYETGGTFDPWQAGPTTKWGQHRGLIQWGEPQAKQYGVTQDMPVPAQVEAAGKYLVDRGVKPGMGLLDIYSAINAGGVGLYNRTDAHAGGAPGTVADKVNNQMGGHRKKAEALLGGLLQAPQASPSGVVAPPQQAAPQQLAGLLAPQEQASGGSGLLSFESGGQQQSPMPQMKPLEHLPIYFAPPKKAGFAFKGYR
jgi:hypothetical protein